MPEKSINIINTGHLSDLKEYVWIDGNSDVCLGVVPLNFHQNVVYLSKQIDFGKTAARVGFLIAGEKTR